MRRLPATVCALILCAACSEPPQKEIDRAQGAIDAARAAGADQYATTAFVAATTALHEAHEAVEQRDYRLALSRAIDANERALEAAKDAANGKARAHTEVDGAMAAAGASLQQLRTKVRAAEAARLPAKQLDAKRRTLADAERALQEARTQVAAGEFNQARARVKDLPVKISAEIRELDEAITARSVRPGRRRR